MKIFSSRDVFKPFTYDWPFELFDTHEKMHWTPHEVPLLDDVKDWNNKLSQWDRNFLTQVFRFFTQGDIDIGKGYLDYYIPIFKLPELRMMLTSFAAREQIHIHAYSLLIETIGLPEIEYSLFKQYKAMEEKHKFISAINTNQLKNFDSTKSADIKELLVAIVINSIFGEGMQLFSSFALLLNYQRLGLMTGMCTIVDWSIKDESVHVQGMAKLFNTIFEETKDFIDKLRIENEVYGCAEVMVDLEDRFINLVFSSGGDNIQKLTREELKTYIRYITDIRLAQINYEPLFKIESNPLPWLEHLVEGASHVNFFERRSTDYAKGSINWDLDKLRF